MSGRGSPAEALLFYAVRSAANAVRRRLRRLAEPRYLIGLAVGLIGLQAKLERTPFDIPEAETEIVAGPWTELTGRRLALMHLSMHVMLVVGSGLIAALFLGGPLSPWTISPPWLAWIAGFAMFLGKTLVILLILASIKVATGRIRIDQLNDIGWKFLASATIVQVALVLFMDSLGVGG